MCVNVRGVRRSNNALLDHRVGVVCLLTIVAAIGCGSDKTTPNKNVGAAGMSAAAGAGSSPLDAGSGPQASTDSGTTSVNASSCVPGEVRDCPCLGGSSGNQTCAKDGKHFEPCQCQTSNLSGDDAGALTVPDLTAPTVGTLTTLYVHGRDTDGEPSGWTYWLHKRPGINARPVNWDGTQKLALTNDAIRNAFDQYCTGDNWCYVACHSTGCPQVGYALDFYGANGDQLRWNIAWVMAAGSAEGGSELADRKWFSIAVPLDEDLRVLTMRNMYDHNNTYGISFYMHAGNGIAAGNALLPGADDGAVAFHSSGGIDNTGFNTTVCYEPPNNPKSGCEDLLLDQNSSVWAYHTVFFRDDAEVYSHFLSSKNEGICSVMFANLEANAK